MRRWVQRLGRRRLRYGMALAVGVLLLALGLTLARRGPDAGHGERPRDVGTVGTPGAAVRGTREAPESTDARLERLIATKVEADVTGDHEAWSNPSFQLYHGLTDDELRAFRRDPGRVVDRLLRFVAAPGDEARRQKVLRSLGIFLDEAGGPEASRQFLSRGVAMLAAGTLPVALETDLAWALAMRGHSIGMDEADRAAIRDRARIALRSQLPHPDYAKVWALSLALLGGPEEKEIILGSWDRLDRGGRSMVLETDLFRASHR